MVQDSSDRAADLRAHDVRGSSVAAGALLGMSEHLAELPEPSKLSALATTAATSSERSLHKLSSTELSQTLPEVQRSGEAQRYRRSL